MALLGPITSGNYGGGGGVKVQIQGLKELEESLVKLPDKLAKSALQTGLRQGAGIIRKAAIQNVRARTVERTGALIRGILVNLTVISRGIKGSEIIAKVGLGKGAQHGVPLEFGTYFFSARPFLRPAFDNNSDAALARVIEAIRKMLPKLRAKALKLKA
jgi:HK97 gp10 family phage protein